MFKNQITTITFDNLSLRYPPSVAQFLLEEIAKAELAGRAPNRDRIGNVLPGNADQALAKEVA